MVDDCNESLSLKECAAALAQELARVRSVPLSPSPAESATEVSSVDWPAFSLVFDNAKYPMHDIHGDLLGWRLVGESELLFAVTLFGELTSLTHVFYNQVPIKRENLTPQVCKEIWMHAMFCDYVKPNGAKYLNYSCFRTKCGPCGVFKVALTGKSKGLYGSPDISHEYYIVPFFTGTLDYLRLEGYWSQWLDPRSDEWRENPEYLIFDFRDYFRMKNEYVPECVAKFNVSLNEKVEPRRFEELALQLAKPLPELKEMALETASAEFEAIKKEKLRPRNVPRPPCDWESEDEYRARRLNGIYLDGLEQYLPILDKGLFDKAASAQCDLWGRGSERAKQIEKIVLRLKKEEDHLTAHSS